MLHPAGPVAKNIMKSDFITTALLLGTLSYGCTTHQPRLVLGTVGPAPAAFTASASTGTLAVYSAFDPTPDFNGVPYRRRHSDYQILSPQGQLLQGVQNDNATSWEGPKRITLPAGNYRVVAHANGYGLVTVPVLIEPGRVTTVHLEGSASWPDIAELRRSDPVRLPDGEIAGWRAGAETLPKP